MIDLFDVEDGVLYYESFIVPVDNIDLISVSFRQDYREEWTDEDFDYPSEVEDGFSELIIIKTLTKEILLSRKVKQQEDKIYIMKLQRAIANKIWGETSDKKYM